MKIAALGTLVLFTGAAAHAAEKFPKCFNASRHGHCVALQVNGQRTARMTKRTKKQLEGLDFGTCEVRYEVPSPIRGDLDLRADWIPDAVGFFGAGPEVTVHVFPLDGQSLDTHPEISSAPSVRVGGQAVVTQANVVEGRLPPGRYVLTARVSGSIRNWDCHAFFVQVAQ